MDHSTQIMAEGAALGSRELFGSGYNCSQAVLLAAADALGMGCDCLGRAASGLGEGLGRSGEVCGALNGGVMCLGLVLGEDAPDDPWQRDILYATVARFVARFEEENGAARCRELLRVDLGTAEGREESERRDLDRTVCGPIVERAVRAAVEIAREQEAAA